MDGDAAEATALAAAEALERATPEARFRTIEQKLIRARRKEEQFTKDLETQQDKLEKLKEQIQRTKEKLERHTGVCQALLAQKAQLQSELSSTTAAAAGNVEGAAAMAPRAASAVCVLLPQFADIVSQAKCEAFDKRLADIAAGFEACQTSMDIDDKGNAIVHDALEGRPAWPERDLLEWLKLRRGKERDKGAPVAPVAPVAPAAEPTPVVAAAAQATQAAGTLGSATGIVGEGAASPAASGGETEVEPGLVVGKAAGKIREKVAGGAAGREQPYARG